MRILVLIDEAGQARRQIPVSDDSALLVCSSAARADLAQRLESANGRCAQCGFFAKSEELSDGRCKGVGCDVDPTIARLVTLSSPAQILEVAVRVQTAMKTWFDSNQSPVDTLAEPEPDDDILRGW